MDRGSDRASPLVRDSSYIRMCRRRIEKVGEDAMGTKSGRGDCPQTPQFSLRYGFSQFPTRLLIGIIIDS